jgi:transposase
VMTAEACAAIVKTVGLGVWPDRAAQIHGVNPATMRAHRARHPSFATALEKAEATAEAGFMAKILRHTEKQWTAAAWMLERRWPDRWAKREVVLDSSDVEPDPRFD